MTVSASNSTMRDTPLPLSASCLARLLHAPCVQSHANRHRLALSQSSWRATFLGQPPSMFSFEGIYLSVENICHVPEWLSRADNGPPSVWGPHEGVGGLGGIGRSFRRRV